MSVPAVDIVPVRIDDDLRRRIHALSRRTGRSPQDLVREAFVSFLSTAEDYRIPAWVGSWGPVIRP